MMMFLLNMWYKKIWQCSNVVPDYLYFVSMYQEKPERTAFVSIQGARAQKIGLKRTYL